MKIGSPYREPAPHEAAPPNPHHAEVTAQVLSAGARCLGLVRIDDSEMGEIVLLADIVQAVTQDRAAHGRPAWTYIWVRGRAQPFATHALPYTIWAKVAEALALAARGGAT